MVRQEKRRRSSGTGERTLGSNLFSNAMVQIFRALSTLFQSGFSMCSIRELVANPPRSAWKWRELPGKLLIVSSDLQLVPAQLIILLADENVARHDSL